MAKKATTTKQNNNNEPGKFAMMKMFFTNERTRFITGLVIAIITIYIGLALISFFFTGGADQSKIENVPLADLLTNRGSVENWTGVRGAVLADLLMNRWFGISSFMILFFLGSVGIDEPAPGIAVETVFVLCSHADLGIYVFCLCLYQRI